MLLSLSQKAYISNSQNIFFSLIVPNNISCLALSVTKIYCLSLYKCPIDFSYQVNFEETKKKKKKKANNYLMLLCAI